ncbi:MAG TPA: branched-chain amino acid ABC transporter substrate-binding protein [Dehalococcoidia bacterium]|nr:branched-chain amino acid ABC transporter substrate-binding protein [Dehalococcoidia bacterium]
MRLPVLFTAASLAVTLSACGGGGEDVAPTPGATPAPTAAFEAPLRGEVRAFPGERLVLGVSAPMVGGDAWGADLRDAVRLAVEDAGGRVAGVAVTVDARDDGCDDPERPAAVAARFAQNPAVFAVVGPACNNGEFVAGPVYEYASRVHVSPSATRVRPAERPLQTFFRTAWRDDRQGELLARYAFQTLGARRAYIVDDGSDYGQVVAYSFAKAFGGLGGEVAGHGRADIPGVGSEVSRANPDVVTYGGLAAGGAALAQALRQAGYTGPLVGPDALLDVEGFLAPAGDAAAPTVVLGPPPLDPDFVRRFQTRFGRAPLSPFTGHAYDAARMLLAAAERAAVTSPDGAVVIANQRLREELLAQPYEGLTGPIAFGPTGDREGDDAAALGLAFYEVRDRTFAPLDSAARAP